jgi:drug/metabolite transporter (DMT)-like permease
MTTKLTFKQIITAGAIAAGVAVVINAILFFTFHSAGVISDTVFLQPNQPLTVVPVIMSSILPTLVGACVFFLFEKYTTNGFKIFSIVAVVLVFLSLASPFMAVQGMPVAYGVVLCIMHLVVAFSLLYFLKRAKQ